MTFFCKNNLWYITILSICVYRIPQSLITTKRMKTLNAPAQIQTTSSEGIWTLLTTWGILWKILSTTYVQSQETGLIQMFDTVVVSRYCDTHFRKCLKITHICRIYIYEFGMVRGNSHNIFLHRMCSALMQTTNIIYMFMWITLLDVKTAM